MKIKIFNKLKFKWSLNFWRKLGWLGRIIPIKFFGNLKIGIKLILGFITVALIAGVIGLVGTYNIYRINQAQQDVYKKVVVGLGMLPKITQYVHSMDSTTYEYVNDPENRASYESQLKITYAKINKIIDDLIKSGANIDIEGLKGAVENYWREEEIIFDLCNSDQILEANRWLTEGHKATAELISSRITMLFNILDYNASELTKTNNTTALNTIRLMLALVGAGMVIAVGLGLLIARTISKPMRRLTDAAQKVAAGDVTVAISTVNGKDETAILTNAFVKMVDFIREHAKAAEQIAAGNLDVAVNVKSENDLLAKSMMVVITTLRELAAEIRKLTDAASAGQLGERGDTSKFTGEYQQLIAGVNDTLDAVVNPLRAASDYLERIGRGDIPEMVTEEFRGDFNQIKDSLNACITGLRALVSESLRLSEAATAGALNVRSDLDQFNGEYRQVIRGLNATMDAIVAPLTEAREVLGKMAVNDYTVAMTGNYQGMLKEFAEQINLVRTRLLSVEKIFIQVSQGDISQLEELRANGKQSDNDQLVPAAIAMMQAIQDLIDGAELVAQAAAEGRLEVRGDAEKLTGKYQNIILGMNAALDGMSQPIVEAMTVLEAMAQGDLGRTMDGLYRGDYARIQGALNATVDTFNQILGEINTAAEQVASASRQLSAGSQTLSQGASEQAATVQELSASTTMITNQIKQNALQAQKAAELAKTAKQSAGLGNAQMQEMLQAMHQINESAGNIAKIIKVIDEIAFQTNILALNAAVEAARAGQYGKGFAVVAEEVRNLAGRSAQAAKETAELIEGSLRQTEDGSRIANQTAAALSKIVTDVTTVVDLVESIDKASSEQAAGINQINQGVSQVAQVTQTNTATAEESASSSEELAAQAENLRRLVGRFRLKEEPGAKALLYTKERERSIAEGKRNLGVLPQGNRLMPTKY